MYIARNRPSQRYNIIIVHIIIVGVKSTSDWISLVERSPRRRSSISEQTFNSRLHYFRGARTGRLPLVSASASPLARTRASPSNGSPRPPRNNRDFTPRGPLRFSQQGSERRTAFCCPTVRSTFALVARHFIRRVAGARASKYLFIVSGDQFVCEIIYWSNERAAPRAANLFDLRLETRFGKDKHYDLRFVDSIYLPNRHVHKYISGADDFLRGLRY